MLKNFKMFVIGFLTCALLMGTIAGVAAAGNDLNIQAVLSNTIKLKLNGKDWTPKDPATGNYYKPISYNGRTYLPVRAVVEEAAGMPVEYDSATDTVWIGGRTDSLNVSSTDYYEDYYGTVITTDTEKISTPEASYKWGVTNDKDLNMQYFTFYLKPNGNYKRFRASFFLDSSAKDSLTMNIRKDNPDGQVIKTLDIQPGQTVKDVDLDIGGVNKLCIESNIAIKHGIIKKIVIGEPVFYNGNLPGATPTHK